jgi:sulfur-oxidizing protein SoxZ
MSTDNDARVKLPAEAKPGEIIEIKALISHQMETGRRKDEAGRPVARRIINCFIASFEGETIFQAKWFPSVSANPYQVFYFRAEQSGTFEFTWRDDNGAEYRTTANLRVG